MKTQLNKIIRLIPLSLLLLSGCSGAKNDPNKQLRIINNITYFDSSINKDYPINGIIYYGTYNSYDVVYYKIRGGGEIDAHTEYVINGMYFLYPTNVVIMAVSDIEMITLQEAYNNHIIDNNSIARINKYHKTFFDEYVIKIHQEGGFYDCTSL